ncbi:MAG TPA: glycosyltransferase family 4 protein [Verrucomicrobiae bacterium]|nr:glycosyltransferase family 4 protein [Verrucomicrobiae bacterium]
MLYFNPSPVGGLADYAHQQADALEQAGVSVEMLATPRYGPAGRCRYSILPLLADVADNSSRWRRRISWGRTLLNNYRILARRIREENRAAVLFGAYSEYLAPVWAGTFRGLARAGTTFGAVVHDPVRDYAVGPQWWHRRSIAAAYSFLREAFVHEAIQLETIVPMPDLRTTVIPHGPMSFPAASATREQARKKLSIPDGAFVVLSFGHLRDGKNLDLAIEALAAAPAACLVVAGKEQSSGQKPMGYYQELARKAGVAERCRWLHGHVPGNEVGNLFAASDLALLTYSRNFRSASGVLNTAVAYRKPCLASAGDGNLRSVVDRYRLGWFVEPDNSVAVREGLLRAMREPIEPLWENYELENSWNRNALLVRDRMFESSVQKNVGCVQKV